jgi:hypothetical protein
MALLQEVDWAATRQVLRPYQVEAVEAVESFLATDDSASFIVTMPTGSGKSGVIAFISQRCAVGTDVLLVCPWDGLADQLRRDVSERFWDHAGADSAGMLTAKRLLPSNAMRQIEKQDGNAIWVMTLTALQQLKRKPAEWAALKSRLGLVIVDEGHYEPALTWARSVRDLGVPSLIFTATPFRNDRKYFAVERGNSFHYPVQVALADAVLRTPHFETIATESIDSFVGELVDFIDRELAPSERVVVRCGTAPEIRKVVHTLRAKGLAAIGIHDRFEIDDLAVGLRQSVPANDEARIWVHQKKLIEGIDDGAFRALAIYSPFTHDRALVQQIGRVLRDPARSPIAWVLGADAARLERSWRAFVEFDASHDASENPAKAIVEASRRYAGYFGGTFRLALDPDELDSSELRLPMAASVFDAPAGMDDPFATVVEILEQMLDEEDAELVGSSMTDAFPQQFPESQWYLQLHVLPVQSPLLTESAYVDTALGFTFIAATGTRLYVQSTARLDLRGKGFRAVPTPMMRRVFDAASNSFTSVTLRNTDISSVAERSRSQAARSLATLQPDLGDYSRSPSTITGAAESSGPSGKSRRASRYVGFGNARIREHGRLGVMDYLSWLGTIDSQLDAAIEPALIFGRFAEPTTCDVPKIRNVLLEIDSLRSWRDENGGAIELVADCVDVDSSGGFELRLEGVTEPISASLKWDTSHFVFRSADLDSRFTTSEVSSESVSFDVTERQAFRLIVNDESAPDDLLHYINGGFVKPRSGLALQDDADGVSIDRLLATDAGFAALTSEKGRIEEVTETWPAGSLFNHICESVATGSLFGVTVSQNSILVCDDDGHETADFYLLDSVNNRLSVIHAKSKDRATPGAGASGLHEVVAQAQKNLRSIQPGGSEFNRDKMANRWSGTWGGTPANRVRSGHTGEEASDAIWRALRDPNVEREVVVAASGILGKATFVSAARQGKPQALQALYLLQAGWSSVGSIGARFRVVVNP